MGTFLNLAASVLPIFTLKEGGSEFSCNGATIVANFVFSGIMWITLLVGRDSLAG